MWVKDLLLNWKYVITLKNTYFLFLCNILNSINSNNQVSIKYYKNKLSNR